MQPASVLPIVLATLAHALPSDIVDDSVSRRDTTQKEPLDPLHALRDPSKLKYEIVGIFGAYILWLIIAIPLIVLVRNRLRRRVRRLNLTSNTTMMKTFHTSAQVVEVPLVLEDASMMSPRSPVRVSSVKSWGKRGHKANISIQSVSSLTSTQSHEAHRAKDMDELTKLYAAVIAHDEERSQGRNSAAQTPVSPTKTSPTKSPTLPTSPRIPPEFLHLRNASTTLQSARNPAPSQALHHPLAPTPIDDSFPQEDEATYDSSFPSRNSSRTYKTTPLSFVSDNTPRAASIVSTRSRPSRISVRGLPISQPIGSADLRDARFYDETIPLSPRIYTPGPPPPTPGKKKVQIAAQPVEAYEPESHQHQYRESHSYQQEHHPGRYQPQRTPSLPKSPRDKRASPPNLSFRPGTFATVPLSIQSAVPANAPKALPFRDLYGDASLRSAPATKTTFLDHPTKPSGGPRTGTMPPTPYSAYMPNTPMTPITPRRLPNKQELKAKMKHEQMKVVHEDDMAEDADEVWGT